MAEKRADLVGRAVGGIATFVAGFVARKVMTLAWKRIMGKEPPEHPEDPEVALVEALGWATLIGLAMSTAKLLATRAATKRFSSPAGEEQPESPAAE
ncbi:MAG TPA: DUF4235 domain-containing protein [Streptosporangiaceae bacterium]|jgi:hypothetical protein